MSNIKKIATSIGLSLLLISTASAQNQPVVTYKQTYGHWAVECMQDPNNTANKSCLMTSISSIEVTNPENEKQKQSLNALRASVVLLDNKTPTLILSVLPGTLLIPGLSFTVDNKPLVIDKNEVRGLSFERCLPDGCITGFTLKDAAVLETLKKSNNLNISYQNDIVGSKKDDYKINLSVSMNGFTNALNDLQGRAK